MSYCVKCGNTGIDIDGNPCTCRMNVQSFYESVSCLDVPEQYRGIAFMKGLVPTDVHESYANYLQSVYDKITTGKWHCKNCVIASPIGHSKTILAYSCMEILFRNGIPTFPIFDIFELKRLLLDMDFGKKSVYEVANPELIINAPILFVKVPRVTSWETYDVMSLILDRRVRRSNSTIFLFDGTWSELIYNDKRNILTGLVGDGNYNTVEVKTWDLIKTPEVTMQIPENIG